MKNLKLQSSENPDFQSILARRLSRRGVLKGSAVLGAAAVTSSLSGCGRSDGYVNPNRSPITFTEVPHGLDTDVHVPEEYDYQVLLRWGDGIFPDSPDFVPLKQTESSQLKQFGFNNDFIGYLPLPLGSNNSDHGLLVVNHEYTSSHLMFPDVRSDVELDREQTRVDIAAHGLSIIEIQRSRKEWQVLKDSKYNRRITPHTPAVMTGAAAGSKRFTTYYSNDGVKTLGTYGNCAGGVTPWGTILTGEENINYFFMGELDGHPEEQTYRRFGFDGKARGSWGTYFDRWDLTKTPNEGLHMGWVVEIDPFDPDSKPMKRTALGRCKHEGCNIYITQDNSVVAYTGDDQKFEYVYKFVSAHKYLPEQTEQARKHNMRLLEEGTLYVAKLHSDGKLNWLPLVFGEGLLTQENGFASQADVLIESRKAADLVQATPMDRPEDVEVNPVSGKVYVNLTKNGDRKPNELSPGNPRSYNHGGQIVEFIAPDDDHTSDEFKWEIFILAGKPDEMVTYYHPQTPEQSWLACPDNCAFDNKGNIWVATDGAESFGVADGLWAIPTEGEYRGLPKRFLRTPIGAELCGPYFSPDNRTLFCSIQHPGNGGSFDEPQTRWPDNSLNLPARPSVIVVTKKNGGVIGEA